MKERPDVWFLDCEKEGLSSRTGGGGGGGNFTLEKI